MIDPTGNFIISTVNTAPDPADEGTTLTVDSADEGLFTSLIVTGAFNAVVWPFGVEPRISSAEIVRVTDITDGVFTIERGQEGTTARNIATGWNIAVTPTSKTITDIWEEIELRFNKTGGEISGDATITDGNALEFENPDGDSVASLYNNGTTGVNALETDSDFKSLGNITANNLSGTNTGDQVIPEDVSDLTDTTGIIPADVSDLTDTTGVIPADVSDLTDTTGIISDKADKSNVLELDNTSEFTPDADYEPATKKYADTKIAKTTNITSLNETGIADGEIAVFNLTNKDIRTSNKTLPSGDVVGTSDTQTLTGKTIDGDDNTVQDLPYSAIKSTSRSGSDTTLITGTKGTNGDLAQWNVDGDLVDGPTPPSGAIVGTTDTQTLTNKTLTSPVINTPTGDIVTPTGTQTLTNKTLTSPKVNENVALTVTSTELNLLDGVTASKDELNIVDNGGTTEKVLNTQCKCKVYLGSAQDNIADATNVKVNLATEVYDIGNDFDTGNKRFVAPVSGYYLCSGAVGFSGVIADKTYQTLLYVNGAAVSYTMVHSSHTGALRVPFSDIVYVAAGQYIELYARANAGASTVDLIATSTSTYLNIHLLSI